MLLPRLFEWEVILSAEAPGDVDVGADITLNEGSMKKARAVQVRVVPATTR